MLIAKAINLAFESRIKEKLKDLIICSDATSTKFVEKMLKWHEILGISHANLEKNISLPKEATCENMVQIFC